MRAFLATAAMVIAATGPAAAENHEKQCILAAAGKLPVFIAARVDQSSVRTLGPAETLYLAVDAFLNRSLSAEATGTLEARDAAEFEALLRQPDRERPRAMITAALKKQDVWADTAKLSGRAAGIEVSYSATCIFNSDWKSLLGIIGPVLDD